MIARVALVGDLAFDRGDRAVEDGKAVARGGVGHVRELVVMRPRKSVRDSSWSEPSTLTQKRLDLRISGQLVDQLPAVESDKRRVERDRGAASTTSPTARSPSGQPVTTQTPVG